MRKIFLLALLLLVASQYSQGQTTNYQVYALFVFNIAKYSSWPEGGGSEIHITVVGKSKAFEELLKQNGKVVNGSTIKVSQVEDYQDVGQTQIIYLSDGKSSVLEDIQKLTHGKPVLIITEREGLFKKGASFSFVVLDNKTLRFDINITELEKRSIKVSKNITTLANSSI
jgi:hypothetical protein